MGNLSSLGVDSFSSITHADHTTVYKLNGDHAITNLVGTVISRTATIQMAVSKNYDFVCGDAFVNTSLSYKFK